tara:strand:+ start:443 stop:1174 length:732 start_codon:yes stop_codon:yes gene_type:complete
MKKSKTQSTNVLYIVFLLTLVTLGYYLMNYDYESIFLFIFISTIVYLFDENMIIVLGVPLVFVNVMILLKRMINTHEGFESMSEDVLTMDDKKNVAKWLQNNLSGDNANLMDYELYNVSINSQENIKPLKEIVEDIIAIDLEDDTPLLQGVEDLVKYIKEVRKIEKEYNDRNEKIENSDIEQLYNDNQDEISFAKGFAEEIEIGIMTEEAINEVEEDMKDDDEDEDMDEDMEDDDEDEDMEED